MRRLSLLVFPLIAFCLVAAQNATEVEITAEPSHHQVLENEYVRVFSVEAPPRASTLIHWHRHDYIFVTLGAADVSNEIVGKAPFEMKLKDGEARFATGNFAHLAKNLADTPFRNVTIEFLQDEKSRQTPSHWPDQTGERTLPGVRVNTLFVKDGVKVSDVTMDAEAVIPMHHHDYPHLVVAVSDLQLRGENEGGPSGTVSLKSGEVRWVKANVTHKVTNEGQKAARFVTVEF